MPVRAEFRPLYRGPSWNAIRQSILHRAGHKCERCGAPNRRSVLRAGGWWTPFTWHAQSYHLQDGDAASLIWKFGPEEKRDSPAKTRIVRIVLTIAHLNHDPSDNRPENLQALCQWCHLGHDRKLHLANARRTRARRSGQLWLCAAEAHPCDLIAQIERCDREIAEIQERPDVVAGDAPAWLVTLGIEDWLAEKRLLLDKLAERSRASGATK